MPYTLDKYTEGSVRGRLSAMESLRSYKREESHGVTYIYFYIGPSLAAHGLGLLTLGVANVGLEAAFAIAGHNNLYFDTDTGEYLSNGQDTAAEKLNRMGKECSEKKEYDKAKNYFNRAYLYCSKGYCEEAQFKRNRETAQTDLDRHTREEEETRQKKAKEEADAIKLAEVARQQEIARQTKLAQEKEAARIAAENLRKSEEARRMELEKEKEKEKMAADRRQKEEAERAASDDAEAIAHSEEGMKHWKNGNFAKAKDSFEFALLTCTAECRQKTNFERRLEMAKTKLAEEAAKRKQVESRMVAAIDKAEKMYVEGAKLWEAAWTAENLGEAEEATEKFEEVKRTFHNICLRFSFVSEFERYREMVHLKIRANTQFNQGQENLDTAPELMKTGNFEAAAQALEKALGRMMTAKVLFQKGFQRESGHELESKFQECVQEVEEAMGDIKNFMTKLEEVNGADDQELKDANQEIFTALTQLEFRPGEKVVVSPGDPFSFSQKLAEMKYQFQISV